MLTNGDVYALRLFGTSGPFYYDYVKLNPSNDTVSELYFTSKRYKFVNIAGGGILYVYDRVCVLHYPSVSYDADGTSIPADYCPDELVWNNVSRSGSELPYRIGVRANGTVVLQAINGTTLQTASDVRGQIVWIRAHTT